MGKTAVSALLARAFLDLGPRPVLLIDADPAGGLVSAIGEQAEKTLASARDQLIAAARGAGDSEKTRLAQNLDYLVMEALVEGPGYSLLAMGRMEAQGCFCPANTLLREAIDLLAEPFSLVLIDAEAGLEQIARQVTRSVTRVIALSDGSSRSVQTIELITQMVDPAIMGVIGNRVDRVDDLDLPPNVEFLGIIPEDSQVRSFDRQGRSLWDLPPENPALAAARSVAEKLINH
ncbi:MAG: hypothetical protein JEZ02_12340 [Desulfatibacillum sp.]|nr:hypothetical protein [Desulfatibacillum sp.]